MKRAFVLALAAVIAAGFVGNLRAEDKSNPTGTWKWSMTGPGGQSREATLKLKMEGDKLTGAIVGREGQETKIENASYKDGVVSFEVTRERNGQKMTVKYKGKLSGDTITGTTEFARGGGTQSRAWEAKRQ
jgi:hypothetical protein